MSSVLDERTDRVGHRRGGPLAHLAACDEVDSATVRHDLRRLTHSFVRRRRHGPVRELYPRLTAALHRPLP